MSGLQLYECVADLLIVARKQRQRIAALTAGRADAERRAAELAVIHTEDRSQLFIESERIKYLNEKLDAKEVDIILMKNLMRSLYLVYVGFTDNLECDEFDQLVELLRLEEFGPEGKDTGPEDAAPEDAAPPSATMDLPF